MRVTHATKSSWIVVLNRELARLGFYWVLLGFTWFHGVLLDYIGFHRVLLDFTGFYWVLLGFTEFYWVLLGFTWRTRTSRARGRW